MDYLDSSLQKANMDLEAKIKRLHEFDAKIERGDLVDANGLNDMRNAMLLEWSSERSTLVVRIIIHKSYFLMECN